MYHDSAINHCSKKYFTQKYEDENIYKPKFTEPNSTSITSNLVLVCCVRL